MGTLIRSWSSWHYQLRPWPIPLLYSAFFCILHELLIVVADVMVIVFVYEEKSDKNKFY